MREQGDNFGFDLEEIKRREAAIERGEFVTLDELMRRLRARIRGTGEGAA